MKKLLIEGALIIILFVTSWFVLRQVNWISILKVEEISRSTEEKLGDLSWGYFKQLETVIEDDDLTIPIDSLLTKICESNNIDRSKIKLHIIDKDEINAFALPDNHLVLYTGLIRFCDNEAQLTGVIGHEVAHMELDHVMKKLVKEIGLSALISLTTGNAGGNVLKETVKVLSSSAFDRNLEKAADLKAVDYLVNAKIDPEQFANFLFKMSENQPEFLSNLSWINTHPESMERAKYVIEYSAGKKTDYKEVLAETTWEDIKVSLDQ